MDNLITLILTNLEKVGIGIALFMGAYLSNMGLGAWKNVKIDGSQFDWNLIKQSAVKFIVVGVSLTLLTMVVSVLPAYATYVGIEIGEETMQTIDSLVIVGAFLSASVKYITDSISKVKTIFDN